MTEAGIFKIILKNCNNNDGYGYDYPKLQGKAADIAAEKFTEIIYETMKQKSTASHTKRGNILKYIHNMCGVKQCHLNEDSYEYFLRTLRQSIKSDEISNASQLVRDIHVELEEEVPSTLVDKVIEFYKRKNCKRKEKTDKLEFIGKMSQEKLDLKFNMQVRRNFSYYETSESLIKDLIDCPSTLIENKLSITQTHCVEYREKQIKFCYALLNLRNSDMYLIETILERLSSYKKLEPFETNFLMYLFLLEDESLNFAPVVSEKFPLVLERLLLKYAAEIVQLDDDAGVCRYFKELQSDNKMAKIRKICAENVLLNKTMKSMIYELYCYSFCNENLLKLNDFLQ